MKNVLTSVAPLQPLAPRIVAARAASESAHGRALFHARSCHSCAFRRQCRLGRSLELQAQADRWNYDRIAAEGAAS